MEGHQFSSPSTVPFERKEEIRHGSRLRSLTVNLVAGPPEIYSSVAIHLLYNLYI